MTRDRNVLFSLHSELLGQFRESDLGHNTLDFMMSVNRARIGGLCFDYAVWILKLIF